MRDIMLMYNPVKKEIHFLVNNNGAYREVDYVDCPRLQKYCSANGEFLLQDQGTEFFENISNTFLGIEDRKVVFKGTKIDYEDFVKMVKDYNNYKGKEILRLGDFIELSPVDSLYKDIFEFYQDIMNTFEKDLQDSSTKKMFYKRKAELEKKIKLLNSNNVNLCVVGTYSAGKSAFINAIIGKRILPENINSETAKMFKIQNSALPSVTFVVKENKQDNGKLASIVWNEEFKQYMFTTEINDDGIKGKVYDVIRENKEFLEHEQLYSIIEVLNTLPNRENDNYKKFIDGIIEVNYPISLCRDINFTFFDTPGTDSNSEEHLEILENALQKQTNSILLIVYSALKMEGNGNSVLYKLLNKSQNEEVVGSKVTIDLSRSFHIVNQVDRFDEDEIESIRSKKIVATLSSKNEIDEDNVSKYEYDLQKKRVFYVSSKAAYCAKAKLQGVSTKIDDKFLRRNLENILEDNYFLYDNLSEAVMETEELKALSLNALKECEAIEDKDERELRSLVIASGMYAIEQEIIKYANKYALAVKAKGLYDGVINVISGVRTSYEAIESQARDSKEKIRENIAIMKNNMISDINECYKQFEKYINEENMRKKFVEVENIHTVVTNINNRGQKEIKRMPKIAMNANKFEDKNRKITTNLNEYARILDEFYKKVREDIYKRQMKELYDIISAKIKEYKGVGEELLNQILNISYIDIPESKLSPIKMDKYINKEKTLFVFQTTDKKDYVETVTTKFIELITRQYDNYIKEMEDLAKKQGENLKEQFISNISILSGSLEKLINDEKVISEEQRAAKAVLDNVQDKYEELNNKMWRAINE